MSLVIGIEHPGGVLLASDSYVGNDKNRDLAAASKFVRRRSVLLAFVGDLRYRQLGAQIPRLPPPRRGEDDEAYLVRAVVTPLREAHAELLARLKKGDDPDYSVLAVYRGRVYWVTASYGVVRSRHGYAAAGDADYYAQGALAAADLLPGVLGRGDVPDPRRRALLALKAAARHSNSVAPPWRWASQRWPLHRSDRGQSVDPAPTTCEKCDDGTDEVSRV